MGQQLRITYEGKDFSFQILNNMPIDKGTEEIRVLLDGTAVTLVREGNNWRGKDDAGGITGGLANAIGKAICLRYRV
jgi:hypothetical protein